MSIGEIDTEPRQAGPSTGRAGEWMPDDWDEMSPRERVEHLYVRNWTLNKIGRTVGLTTSEVDRMVEFIDDQFTQRVTDAPDRVRAAHTAAHQNLMAFAVEQLYGGVGTEKGPDPRWMRLAMEASEKIRKIHGLDAPEKSVSLSMQLRQLVSPAQQQALINDPKYREHLLALEQIEREHNGQGPRDVAGAVRGDGELRPPDGDERLVLPEAPGPPELEADGGGLRRDPAADDPDVAATREVGTPLGLVPGLVPGDLPRPGGDLGEL